MKNVNFDVRKKSAELWIEYEAFVRRFCALKLKDKPWHIDDCVQDVFLDLNVALKNGVKIENYKSWLIIVARNKISDIYRNSKKEAENIIPLTDEMMNNIPDCGGIVFERIDLFDEDLVEGKEEFLSTLSERELMFFTYRFAENKSSKEIALLTGTSESNVRKMIYRIRQKAKVFAKKYIKEHLR